MWSLTSQSIFFVIFFKISKLLLYTKHFFYSLEARICTTYCNEYLTVTYENIKYNVQDCLCSYLIKTFFVFMCRDWPPIFRGSYVFPQIWRHIFFQIQILLNYRSLIRESPESSLESSILNKNIMLLMSENRCTLIRQRPVNKNIRGKTDFLKTILSSN